MLQLLQSLAARDATEFAVMTGRLPCVKKGGAWEPLEEEQATNAFILRLIEALDGRPHLASIGAQSVQWTAQLDGVGEVEVMAARRGEVVQVRVMPTAPAHKRSMRPSRRMPAMPKIEVDAAPHKTRRSSLRPPKKKSSDAISLSPPSPDDMLEAIVVPQHRAVRIMHQETALDLDGLLGRERSREASDLHVVAGRPPLVRLDC